MNFFELVKYPDVAFAKPLIDNLLATIADEEYQAGALKWAIYGTDEPPDDPIILEPFKLIGDSLGWKERGEPTPSLLVIGCITNPIVDDGQGLTMTHRIAFDIMLSDTDDEKLSRETYWRLKACDMMIRSIPAGALTQGMRSTGEVTNLNVTGHNADGLRKSGIAYERYPLFDVEITITETATY